MSLTKTIFSKLGPKDPTSFSTEKAIALVMNNEKLRAINADVPHKVMSEIL